VQTSRLRLQRIKKIKRKGARHNRILLILILEILPKKEMKLVKQFLMRFQSNWLRLTLNLMRQMQLEKMEITMMKERMDSRYQENFLKKKNKNKI